MMRARRSSSVIFSSLTVLTTPTALDTAFIVEPYEPPSSFALARMDSESSAASFMVKPVAPVTRGDCRIAVIICAAVSSPTISEAASASISPPIASRSSSVSASSRTSAAIFAASSIICRKRAASCSALSARRLPSHRMSRRVAMQETMLEASDRVERSPVFLPRSPNAPLFFRSPTR